MSRRYGSRSTLSRIHDIGGADLALRYHEMSERARWQADAAPAAPDPPASRPTPVSAHRHVFANGQRLGDALVAALERDGNGWLTDGDYWYDPQCGAWGLVGGPVTGFVRAGLPLGGPMRTDASGGGTLVFVNGRELHPADVARLATVLLLWPGHYWVDALGNIGRLGLGGIGRVGHAALANVAAAWRRPVPPTMPWMFKPMVQGRCD